MSQISYIDYLFSQIVYWVQSLQIAFLTPALAGRAGSAVGEYVAMQAECRVVGVQKKRRDERWEAIWGSLAVPGGKGMGLRAR